MSAEDSSMVLPEGINLVAVPQQPSWTMGVWAVVSVDMRWEVVSVHRTAEAAVAACVDYQSIRFIPFDADVQAVCNDNRRAP